MLKKSNEAVRHRRLVLHREAIATLHPLELRRAVGGVIEIGDPTNDACNSGGDSPCKTQGF